MTRKSAFLALYHLIFPLIVATAQGTPPSGNANPTNAAPSVGSAKIGVEFVEGSTTTLLVYNGGKRYLVNLVTHEIREASQLDNTQESTSRWEDSLKLPVNNANKGKKKTYEAGDDQLLTLPTGRPLERHGLYVNFTHRFPFESAFSGTARGSTLLGLDDVAISSFGFRFGVTSRLSVFVYRAPSFIERPIEFMGAYTVSSEKDGAPLNNTVRVSVDGQNNFSRNFSTNFEWIASRSISNKAQFYLVPALSLHNRPVLGSLGNPESNPPFQPCDNPHANGLFGQFSSVKPCANTFALGSGIAVDVRPTVALVAEAQPILTNGQELGIHRAAFGFGIQKKIWRHAFTFGFTNSPGTTVSQRVGTRATYLGQPNSDTAGKVFIGFDVMRQIR
jgi:hypothetical protein